MLIVKDGSILLNKRTGAKQKPEYRSSLPFPRVLLFLRVYDNFKITSRSVHVDDYCEEIGVGPARAPVNDGRAERKGGYW